MQEKSYFYFEYTGHPFLHLEFKTCVVEVYVQNKIPFQCYITLYEVFRSYLRQFDTFFCLDYIIKFLIIEHCKV